MHCISNSNNKIYEKQMYVANSKKSAAMHERNHKFSNLQIAH